jgi:hypothetical protein
MSLYDFIMEMGTWFTPSQDLVEQALRADIRGITTEDNKALKELERKWVNGYYDNDHQYLINELRFIAQKY